MGFELRFRKKTTCTGIEWNKASAETASWGTTIKSPELIPDNLAADEKHSRLKGEKVYVPATVGGQCILGASASEDAGERGLNKGYGKFKEEALNLNPENAPKSVSHRRVEGHHESLDVPVSDDFHRPAAFFMCS